MRFTLEMLGVVPSLDRSPVRFGKSSFQRDYQRTARSAPDGGAVGRNRVQNLRGVVWKTGAMLATVAAIAVALLMIVPAGSLAHPGLAVAARVSAASTPIGALERAKPKSCTVGSGPDRAAYDPVTHTMYVPNTGSGTITVLKGACTLVGTISLPTGAYPVMAAFDPGNNYIYVTDQHLSQVYEISGTTVLATITSALFFDPDGIAFDAGFLGPPEMIVTNWASTTIVGISGTTVSGTATVGAAPDYVSYDPSRGTLLVSNWNSANVTIVNASDPFSSAHINVAVGANPAEIAFDPSGAVNYVTNWGSGTVTIVGGFGVIYGTITGLTRARAVGWSQSLLSIYVGSSTAHKIWVISGSTITSTISTPAGSNFYGATYDQYNDDMYVSNFASNVVYYYS